MCGSKSRVNGGMPFSFAASRIEIAPQKTQSSGEAVGPTPKADNQMPIKPSQPPNLSSPGGMAVEA